MYQQLLTPAAITSQCIDISQNHLLSTSRNVSENMSRAAALVVLAISILSAAQQVRPDGSLPTDGSGDDGGTDFDNFLNDLSTSSTPVPNDDSSLFDEQDEERDRALANRQQSAGQSDTVEGEVDSTQLAFIVILSILISIALGVTLYYLRKTRYLFSKSQSCIAQ